LPIRIFAPQPAAAIEQAPRPDLDAEPLSPRNFGCIERLPQELVRDDAGAPPGKLGVSALIDVNRKLPAQ
jgi:hypothetical protein